METLNWLPELQSRLPALLGSTGECEVRALLSPTGRDHTTIRLRTPDGRCFVAKWLSSQQGAGKHYRILASISGTKVAAPSPVGFMELSAGNGSVVLMQHLPGVVWYACAGDPELDRVRIDAAAAVLMHLESLETEKLQWSRTPFAQLRDELHADVEEYRRRIREVPLPPVAREANELLASLAVIEPWEAVADHGDFGPHNLLCDAGTITGLVDWDRAVIRDCSKTIGTAVAEVLGMIIPIGQRAALVERLVSLYADAHGCAASECRARALPHALTRTLDWLIYQKAAPATVHEESLRELLAWRQ